MNCFERIDRLERECFLPADELLGLFSEIQPLEREYLYGRALAVRELHYGRKVYLRGLIEISNYCKCRCRYCGINVENRTVERYRLHENEIFEACERGYELGFRTFVLQGGEDPYFTDDRLTHLVRSLKQQFPASAITLSLGERGYDSFLALRKAGADRYLLRHETASEHLYSMYHPGDTLSERVAQLKMLKSLSYQTGGGCLVGLPGQTAVDYVADLLFIKELGLHMVGIGPFIPHHHTLLRQALPGTVDDVLMMLSLTRLLLPKVLLPATTALATLSAQGRFDAFRVGANVVMPNLTPTYQRGLYTLYDGKKISGNEASEALHSICEEIIDSGFTVAMERGDALNNDDDTN